MNADAITNGIRSAKTPSSAPPSRPSTPVESPKPPSLPETGSADPSPSPMPKHTDGRHLSEEAFLAREAELAREAMFRTLQDLKADLFRAADVPFWTRQHPWAAVGAAAAAGFVAATAMIPSASERPRPPERSPEPPPAPSGWMGWLLAPLGQFARSSVEELLKTAFHAGPSVAGSAPAAASTDGGTSPVEESSVASVVPHG